MNIIKRLVTSDRGNGNPNKDNVEIYLHIGSPKAGSSALQNFMLSARKSLEKHGFYYPEHGIDKNGISGGHGKLIEALKKQDTKSAEERLSEWIDYCHKNELSLILSSESFFNNAEVLKGLMINNMGIGRNKINIIAFVRSPVDYLMANYNQGIKRHGSIHSLSQHLASVLKKGKPTLSGQPLMRWADVFGDSQCRFINYHKPGLLVERIEETFLKQLGIPVKEIKRLLPDPKITNRSYTRSALELKRVMNTVLGKLPASVGNEIDWALQRYSDLHPEEVSLNSSDIPRELYQDVSKKFLADMRPILERFPSLDEAILFPKQNPRVTSNSFAYIYQALAFLEVNCPKELKEIRNEAFSQKCKGAQSYTFIKLLDLLDIEFTESSLPTGLSKRARSIIASNKESEADRLRELGLYFESKSLLSDAVLLLAKAHELRPSGKSIIKAYERVLDAHKKSL